MRAGGEGGGGDGADDHTIRHGPAPPRGPGAVRVIARARALFAGDALRARALRGTAITIGAFGAGNLIRLGSNLILTRLLFPEAFGLMALVQVVLIGLVMVSDAGLNLSVMQNRRGLEPDFLRTTWTVQIGRDALLWIATVLLAAPLASFYGEPLLASMLPVSGLTLLIAGFRSTKLFTANRALLLGRITAIDLASQVVGIAITVALAFALQSVWALVLGTVAGSAVKTVLSHVALPGHRDRLGWDAKIFGELLRFGKWVFLSSIAGFLVNNADRAILGKFVDIGTLGIFNIGYFLATVPMTLAGMVNSRILMPLFVTLADDDATTTRRKMRRTRLPMVGGLVALSVGLAVAGDWIVDLLYDPQYTLAGPILVLLALSSAVPIIAGAYNQMMLARGNSRDAMLNTCAMAFVQTGLLLYGIAQFGIAGALAAPALAAIAIYPLTARLAAKHGGWDPALDAACLGALAAGTALALWVNPDAVAAVLAVQQ